jgi:hypothetical protein
VVKTDTKLTEFAEKYAPGRTSHIAARSRLLAERFLRGADG